MVKLMKKRNYIGAIAIIYITMTGCMKTDDSHNSDVFVIYANRESIYQTKTELQSDNSIVWNQNDELSIFFGQGMNGGYKYVSTNQDKVGSAVFKASGEKYPGEPSAYWAIYPYSENNSFDGNTFTTVLPFVQTAKIGSFNNNLFISVAESSSNHMTFYNVCGGIKFSVPYDNIREVMILNNDGGMLSGTLKIQINDNKLPELESITDGSSVLRIMAPFGETFSVGENYYAVIPPVSLSKGITVKYLTTSGKECSEVIQSPTTIERSVFTRMPRIETDKEFYYSPFLTFVSEGESTIQGSYPISGTTEYSYDGLIWTECSGSKISITKSCPSFFLRGLNSEMKSTRGNTKDEPIFKMTGDKIGCYGSVMKLLDYSSNLGSVPDYCFASMFKGCKQLTHAPELPAITVGIGAYYSMFEQCSSLENTPELPATAISAYCYQSMFAFCSSLKTGPKILPAIQVGARCYGSMFSGCSSLTSAPELPALTMKLNCYDNMFSGCSSLVVAPDLPATTLDSGCYSYMFHNCTSLTSIPDMLPAITLAEVCYSHMFANCSSINQAPSLPAEELARYCYWGMFSGCKSLTTAPMLPARTLSDNCYNSMFSECSSLTSAPELPALTMKLECYVNMFSGCSSLVVAPDLPATTLDSGCYSRMFQNCTSLTSIPDMLPAITLAPTCYSYMFANCSSINQAPSLPAEELARYCYSNMFSGCKSLTKAPDLPALTAESGCYQSMFSGCSKLLIAPTIAATKLYGGCFKEMFSGCTSLTEGPVLYSIDLCSSAYERMFQGCTRLSYIKAMFINNLTQNALLGWLAGVSSTGTFVKNAAATWDNSEAGIPEGWTIEYATE